MKRREDMSYFRNRMRQLRSEYVSADRSKLIKAAGGKCSLCSRRAGDEFIFGPTHYLKKRLKFRVYIDVHVIEGWRSWAPVVMCCACHMSYHLFNRLSEDAKFGSKSMSETVYKRCRTCGELNCMCCPKCRRHTKWCRCRARTTGGA